MDQASSPMAHHGRGGRTRWPFARRCLLAVVVLATAAGARAAEAQAPAASPPAVRAAAPVRALEPPPPLRLLSRTKLSPRLTELEFSTPYLEGPSRVRVLTPVGYADAPDARWPLLLLLHGTSETLPGSPETGYTSWTDRGDAEATTRAGRFLVVMPEARAGLYTDHHGLAGEGGPAWESYHLRQLLPWIDAHYRTIPTRSQRAVAGLSMGGGGAMSYAARHPDLFSFAQSFSGAVDPTDGLALVRATDVNQALLLLDGRPPLSAFGPWLTEEVRTRAHAAVDLVGNLRHTELTLRTGDGTSADGLTTDPVETSVHGQNVELHEALARAGIPHTFDDYGPGGHTWDLFARGLRQLIAPLNAHFAAGDGVTPASFSFTVAEERAEVYDHRLRSDRGFMEFATLQVSPGHLSISGSGTFTITTPEQYAPGTQHRLTATRSGRVHHAVVRADREGRLSFTVDTGRRSTGQQHRVTSTTRVNQVQIEIQPA